MGVVGHQPRAPCYGEGDPVAVLPTRFQETEEKEFYRTNLDFTHQWHRCAGSQILPLPLSFI